MFYETGAKKATGHWAVTAGHQPYQTCCLSLSSLSLLTSQGPGATVGQGQRS